MAGLGGMNVGNAFGGVPQNAGTTQQGSTLQSLPGMGTSTAQQTQQSVAQTPSTLGYAPQQNAQNVFGYNMGRLASGMDPSATLPFYNQYDYRQPQQNINPYQGVTDILGSLGSFFNESIAPTFQSAYDQQFQNFQNQLNEMSQRFAAPPPAAPTTSYTSELDALRQQIAQLQSQIANPVIPTPAPTPAPAAIRISDTTNPFGSVSGLYQNILGREGEQAGLDYWNQRFGNTIEPNEVEEFRLAAQRELAERAQQQFAIPASQNIAPSPAAASGSISLSPAPAPAPLPAPAPTPSSVASYLGLGRAPVQQASNIGLGGGYSIRLAGGGEIEAFNPAMNSGAQSNLISSAERVYDLGPGYRELGVLPGNVTNQTVEGLYRDILGRAPENPEAAQYWQSQFGPSIDFDEIAQFRKAAQQELGARPSRQQSEQQSGITLGQKGPSGEQLTYRNGVLGYYRDAKPGEANPFGFGGGNNLNFDINTGKVFVPFSDSQMKKGGMVHNGMTNRLKHMLGK